MRFASLILVLTILLGSCSNDKYYIPEDDLVNLIVDLHLAEGVMNVETGMPSGSATQLEAINTVLRRHNIERERFDSTMAYYALHVNKYDAVYDKVLDRLMLAETHIKAGEYDKSDVLKAQNTIREFFPEDTVLMDSLIKEFWWDKRNITLLDTFSNERGKFNRYIGDTVNSKAFLLKAEIKLLLDDCAENPKMVLNAVYDSGVFYDVSVPIVKDTVFRLYELYLPLSDTINLLRIKGIFIDHEKCTKTKRAEVKNIRIYELVDSGNPKLLPPKPLLTY